MKKANVIKVAMLLLFFASQSLLAQSDSRRQLDLGPEQSSGNNLNSIKVVSDKEKASIKIKSFNYKSKGTPKKVKSTKKGQDLSLEDLEKLVQQKTNLRYRNKRNKPIPEKCFKEETDCHKSSKEKKE